MAEIAEEMDQVAEGVKAAKVVRELSRQHDVLMPIADQVYAICWEGKDPNFAQETLLRGRIGHE